MSEKSPSESKDMETIIENRVRNQTLADVLKIIDTKLKRRIDWFNSHSKQRKECIKEKDTEGQLYNSEELSKDFQVMDELKELKEEIKNLKVKE